MAIKKQFSKKGLWLGLSVLVVLGVFFIFFQDKLEITKPTIEFKGEALYVGHEKTIEIKLTDDKAGIGQVNISLAQADQTHNLLSRKIEEPGITLLNLTQPIRPGQLKLKEGEARLSIEVTDSSWWKNTTRLDLPLTVDMTPPGITHFSPVNYFNAGGTGFISYRVSEELVLHGVEIDDLFFRGYNIEAERRVNGVFFPLPLAAGPKATRIALVAEDRAGNRVRVSVPHQIRPRKFPVDQMTLSDRFLEQKMPEFAARFPHLKDKSPLDIFIYVNDRMRQDNFKQLQEICAKSSSVRYWEGPFLRMADSSPMAGFGEKRYFFYGGKMVGQSLHEGVDLASTANAPIQAANHGNVSFAGYLGIYGNTVIIDHGWGLFSLYSHLTDIATAVGRQVKRGEVIGSSGLSGLAGGDHLHFAIIVGGHFVNPVEWWDPRWIEHNVTGKIQLTTQGTVK